MNTFKLFENRELSVPMVTSWYLADLGQAIGRQELYTRQSPQKLKTLREHALIESAVSSNRIEGVEVDQARVGTLVFGHPEPKDRNEEEVRGYRDALDLIHKSSSKLPISEETIKQLHELCRPGSWDAGQYKEKDVDIIQTYPDGSQRVRFRTVPAVEAPSAMADLMSRWEEALKSESTHPLILMPALSLDFLCIHPFRDGNGRAARLLLLLTCYHLGIEVGRYISLERIVEKNKERYYETLEQCSQGWHETKHDPWPYINYILFVLKEAYSEFERRMGELSSPRGEKSRMIRLAIDALESPFRVSDVQDRCPGVSLDMIRYVLKDLREAGSVRCVGRGRDAKWEKID